MKDLLLTDFTAFLSFKLGEYQGKGLYKNYPDNFNNLISELAKELYLKTLNGILGEIESRSHPMNTNMFGISLAKDEWLMLKEELRQQLQVEPVKGKWLTEPDSGKE